MRKPKDAAEFAAQWMEIAGFQEDLSSFVAGINDITEAIANIQAEFLPRLLELEHSEREVSLDVASDLLFEFNHIRDHAEAAAELMLQLVNFLSVGVSGTE